MRIVQCATFVSDSEIVCEVFPCEKNQTTHDCCSSGACGWNGARRPPATFIPIRPRPRADLAAALKTAPAAHKRILLDFGGNWCGDCQVLDIYFHDPVKSAQILKSNFILVDINVGTIRREPGSRQEVPHPARKGRAGAGGSERRWPAALQPETAANSKRCGRMESSAVTKFLVQWREPRKGCSVMVLNC